MVHLVASGCIWLQLVHPVHLVASGASGCILCIGMVWYGLVLFGMVWYGLVWFGLMSLRQFITAKFHSQLKVTHIARRIICGLGKV